MNRDHDDAIAPIPAEALFEAAKKRMMTALNAFYLWKWMQGAINVNHVGQEAANANVALINEYPYFFQQVLNSTYKSFVADLAIFFDAEKYEESFSVGKLLRSLAKRMPEGEIADLMKNISEIKMKHGATIGLILELRNADVSHQEIKPIRRVIDYSDMEELFFAVQEVLNLLSVPYDGSVTSWSHIEMEVEDSVSLVFENLERGEKARLLEIQKKWERPA